MKLKSTLACIGSLFVGLAIGAIWKVHQWHQWVTLVDEEQGLSKGFSVAYGIRIGVDNLTAVVLFALGLGAFASAGWVIAENRRSKTSNKWVRSLRVFGVGLITTATVILVALGPYFW